MGMTVTTTTTLISNPSLLSVIIFGGVCYPAVFASAKGCVSASRSSAELGLDAVGLLQAGLEQLLDERPVSGRPGVAQLAPGAKVVKAFNASFAPVFENAAQLEPPADLVFCGDYQGAKEAVSGLIRDIGLERVDVGGLNQAVNVEAFARMNVNLAFGQGRGPLVYRFDTP
jgi:8-hydroxy-5-deazaflavin:NADPH oxidoreductase